jgi:hypothetical protein
MLKIIPWIIMGLLWYSYASFGDTKCEKVERTVSPIRVVLDGLSWAIKPWVSDDTKFTVMKWEIMADRHIRDFFAHQIYQEDLVALGCAKPLQKDDGSENELSFKEQLQGVGGVVESLKQKLEEKINQDIGKTSPKQEKESKN